LVALNPVSDSKDQDRFSQQIYDWLIRPAEAEQAFIDTKTLVFVLDGRLRNIPIAALSDGKQYLIEKYAVALSPGLQLMATRSLHRNHLSAIVGGISQARAGFGALPAVESEVKQISKGVKIIYQCGSHLLMLINDILDLSKIEARKLDLVATSVHLPNFLHGVTEICGIRAEQKGIIFNILISDRLPLAIEVDEKRLRQVLINLLGNAIKFTDSGSVTFKVELLETEQESSQSPIAKIRFQIEDTGIGMSPNQLDKIFLPFEQVGEARQRSEGTGLGLAISHRIVALMGSQIQVQSHLGEGSLFWLDLTVSVPLVHDWHGRAIAPTPQKITGIRGSAPQILIVDDDRNHRSMLTNLLQEVGCRTLEATDGKHGLEVATENNPDVILLDLAMPNMDGFELMLQLQGNPQTRSIPVIVSSANIFESNRQRSLEAGATAFLPKPLQIEELLNKLRSLLKVEWIYAESSSPKGQQVTGNEWILPSQDVLQQLYHLAMMGDISAMEGMLGEQIEQNSQLAPFAAELSKLTTSFQTAKIRKFLKSFVTTELSP
jgi:signal transduction histidine kinase/DNA-binding NarL/FixJ family response regulator